MVLEFKVHEQNGKGLWMGVRDGEKGAKDELYMSC